MHDIFSCRNCRGHEIVPPFLEIRIQGMVMWVMVMRICLLIWCVCTKSDETLFCGFFRWEMTTTAIVKDFHMFLLETTLAKMTSGRG